jgi:hypothetical protein
MTATEKAIADLHAWYCERTGLRTKLCFSQRLWFDMLRAYGNDAAALRADAELIVRYLKREIARDKRNLGSLKLVNFLQPDNFDADLAIARLARGSHAKVAKDAKEPAAIVELENDDPRRLETVGKLRALRQSLGKSVN